MIDPRNPDYQNTPAASGRAVFGYRPASIPDRPEVSVITPYYNVGPVFNETATSMLNQSLQNWEWLIVNDCSSDMESCAILDMHRNGDPRIRVIDLDSNRGLSGARNAGYAEARRVLKPGGSFIFNVWDQIEANEFADVVTKGRNLQRVLLLG
ncbi:MAG: glycosyltransferase family 2 protein [Planctomycetes bacterium]|nr:glycosyltransferase family 2 protein [Planctomycetota bacterium]